MNFKSIRGDDAKDQVRPRTETFTNAVSTSDFKALKSPALRLATNSDWCAPSTWPRLAEQ
jgi:hypothetical protein